MRTLRQPDLIADLRDMNDWNATPAGVRDVVLKGHVIGAIMDRDQELLPKEILALTPTQHNVDRISDSCQQAIRAGRLIDFGRWTNPVIINGGVRGGPLYSRGVLGHPFRDPWMYMHSWEPFPGHTSTSVYLVNPLEPDTPAGDCESIELTPLRIGVNSVLMIGDRIYLHPNRDPETKNLSKYHCSSIPSTWRFLPGAERINNNLSPERAAAGNVLDPLMCALLILSTRGIVRERVEASEKLQKAREKNKQPRIPPPEVKGEALQRDTQGGTLYRGSSPQ